MVDSLYLSVVLSTDVVISGLKCIFHILSVMCLVFPGGNQLHKV